PSGTSPPGVPLPRPSPGSSTTVSRAAPRFLADAPPLAVRLLAFRRSGTGRSLSRTTGAPAEPGNRPARRVCGRVRHRPQAAAAFRWLLVRCLRVQARAYTQLFLDLLLDFVGEIGVVAQEVPRVLLALPKLVALVGVPGTGLAHDGLLHPEVDKATFPTNSLFKMNIEFGLTEWRRAFVHAHIFSDEVVQAPLLHVIGSPPLSRQDLHDPREPELIRQDVVQEGVVKRVSEPLQ